MNIFFFDFLQIEDKGKKFNSIAGLYFYLLSEDQKFMKAYGETILDLSCNIKNSPKEIQNYICSELDKMEITISKEMVVGIQSSKQPDWFKEYLINRSDSVLKGDISNVLRYMLYEAKRKEKLEYFTNPKNFAKLKELSEYFSNEEWEYFNIKPIIDEKPFFIYYYEEQIVPQKEWVKEGSVPNTLIRSLLIAAIYKEYELKVFNLDSYLSKFNKIITLNSLDNKEKHHKFITNKLIEKMDVFNVKPIYEKGYEPAKFKVGGLEISPLIVQEKENEEGEKVSLESSIRSEILDESTLVLASEKNKRWGPNKTLSAIDLIFSNQIESLKHLEKKGKLFEFLTKLGNFKEKEEGVYTINSVAGYTYGAIEFDLNNKTVKTNRTFSLRNKVYVHGHGILSNNMLMALVMTVLIRSYGDKKAPEQTYLDAVLAELTQVWEEEDIYGKILDKHSQLRCVRANTLSILEPKSTHSFPFFKLSNGNKGFNIPKVTEYLVKNKIPFFTDKTCINRIVIGAGVTALYAAFVEDYKIFQTILDTKKPGKLWTRAWQAITIPADEGVDSQESYKEHVECNLYNRHFHEDGTTEDININGDRRMSITGDLRFLLNGSGVGYSWKPWSFSCMKTVRDQIEGMLLKADETPEEAALALEQELNEWLNKARKYDTEKGLIETEGNENLKEHNDTYLFTFRGKKILKYNGLNQQIYVGKKYGSEVRVRPLATSTNISVQLTVKFVSETKEPKVRGLGIKAVLENANKHQVHVTDNQGNKVSDLEVLLGSECLKGNASRLHMYAEYIADLKGNIEDKRVLLYGQGHEKGMSMINAPEVKDGVLTGNRIDIDLTEENNQFNIWWKENTKEYWLYDSMSIENFKFKLFNLAKSESEELTDENVNDALTKLPNISLYYIEDGKPVHTSSYTEALVNKHSVYVCEKFKGLKANYVYQIELASSVECSNAGQSATIQQIGSLYTMSPQYGETVANQSIDQEDAIVDLVSMTTNNPSLKEDINKFLEQYGVTNPKEEYEMSLKDISTFNNSGLAMGWNKIYDKHGDPFLEFFGDTSKKFGVQNLINRVVIRSKDLCKYKGVAKYSVEEAITGSNNNYTISVGVGYNMASVCTYKLVTLRYLFRKHNTKSLRKELYNHIIACGLIWKTVYENSALASYNRIGTKLFIALKASADIYDIKDIIQKVEGIENEDSISDEQVAIIKNIYDMATDISKIESNVWKANKVFKKYTDDIPTLLDIIGSGMFRRMDQGKYANNESILNYLNEDSDNAGYSFFDLFLRSPIEGLNIAEELAEVLPSWLYRKFAKASFCHKEIAYFVKATDTQEYKDFNFDIAEDTANRTQIFSSNGLSTKYVQVSDYYNILLPFLNVDHCSVDEDLDKIIDMDKVLQLSEEELETMDYSDLPTSYACDMKGAFKTEYLAPAKKVGDKYVRELGYKYFKDVDGKYYKYRTLSSKEIIEAANKRYPEGVVLECNYGKTNVDLYLNFNALLKVGAFSSSGAATGIANTICDLIRHICMPFEKRDKKFTSKTYRFMLSIQAKLKGYVKSGLLKRIGKGIKNKQGSKVMTNHHMPYIEFEGNKIPTFALNPNDEIVKAGGYKYGDIVSISRTPMIAKTYGFLILHNSVDIGHLEVCDMVFALTNRGDGDGDPIDITLERHCTEEELGFLDIALSDEKFGKI